MSVIRKRTFSIGSNVSNTKKILTLGINDAILCVDGVVKSCVLNTANFRSHNTSTSGNGTFDSESFILDETKLLKISYDESGASTSTELRLQKFNESTSLWETKTTVSIQDSIVYWDSYVCGYGSGTYRLELYDGNTSYSNMYVADLYDVVDVIPNNNVYDTNSTMCIIEGDYSLLTATVSYIGVN